jgi:vacuolar-type H+-ATPase subunit H
LKSKAQAAFSRASDDADALKNKAKEAGREALDHANNAAQNLASKIDNTTDAAKSKISNA